MTEPALPSPEHLAELARQGAELRAQAEALVADAIAAVGGAEALGPALARDVAAFLERRGSAASSVQASQEHWTGLQDWQDWQD